MKQACIVYINSTINNTIITVANKANDIISIKTQGNCPGVTRQKTEQRYPNCRVQEPSSICD